MKIIYTIFFLLIISNIVNAEPKQLECNSSAQSEIDRLTELANDYADPSSSWHSMDNARDFYSHAEACKNSSFGWKHTYIFDTDGLKDPSKNRAEYTRISCFGYLNPTVEVQISATPSIITFKGSSNPNRFNIDRKNLTAGADTERDFQCKISDIDTSENLI